MALDKLTEQNKETNAKLDKERQHSLELEKKLASSSNSMGTMIAIAIAAVIVGFILAKMLG